MASQIQIKRSSTVGQVPGSLQEGELAVNLKDKILYTANTTAVFELARNTGGNNVIITSNSGETITLTANTLLAASYTLEFPDDDGASGQFLQTDGSGLLRWTTPSGTLSATGTPVDNQLAVWTTATSIEGDANLTWNGGVLAVTGNVDISTLGDTHVAYSASGRIVGEAAFTYNAGTDTLTAGTFSGIATGPFGLTATNDAGTAHYLLFAEAATGNEELRTDTGLTYHPGTETLTANTFAGNFSTSIADTQVAYSNNGVLVGDNTFTYNYTTDTLTASNFSGNGSGLTNLTAANIDAGNLGSGVLSYVATSSTDSAFKIPFINHTAATSGNYALLQESDTAFTYNPATNGGLLSVPTLSVSGNTTIGGDLTVLGTTTIVESTTIAINDSLLKLANNNVTTDVVDIGWYGTYNSSGIKWAGVFRDADNSGIFTFWQGLTAEPGTTINKGTGSLATIEAVIDGGSF